ncbi:threonine/serine exporter family protein [bacterium]|nr:threonine/serine exporter family protein [bacterium]
MAKQYSKHALRKIAGLCIKTAKALMASGAETARVETTVEHIGKACGIPVESYATPTGITVTVGKEAPITVVARVKSRTIDLAKVIDVNNLSRSLAAGSMAFQTADKAIDEISRKPSIYSNTVIYIGQALCCAGFALLLGGGLSSVIPAIIVGALAKYAEIKCSSLPLFLLVFLNAFSVTLFADLCVFLNLGVEHSIIVIAGIIPLLPGLSLTNALADLVAGELLSGMARLTESTLVAAALAAGAAVGISVGQLLTHQGLSV